MIRRELSDINVMIMTTKDFDIFLFLSSMILLPAVSSMFGKDLVLVNTMIL